MSMNEDNHDTEAWLRSRTSRAGGWKMGFSSSVGWPHPHILHILNIYYMNMYDTFSVLILFTCASREMAVQIEHWLHLLLIHPPQSSSSPIPFHIYYVAFSFRFFQAPHGIKLCLTFLKILLLPSSFLHTDSPITFSFSEHPRKTPWLLISPPWKPGVFFFLFSLSFLPFDL